MSGGGVCHVTADKDGSDVAKGPQGLPVNLRHWERGMEQIFPSELLEGIDSAKALIPDF